MEDIFNDPRILDDLIVGYCEIFGSGLEYGDVRDDLIENDYLDYNDTNCSYFGPYEADDDETEV